MTLVSCATHPEVQTGLRCSKCEKPICPRCLVQTPVGARCRECAQLRRLPTFDLPPRLFARGVLAGLGAALGVGVLWSFLPVGRGFFSLVLGAVAGFIIGGVVSRAANRRRNVWLKVVAGACLFLAVVVSELAVPAMRGFPTLLLLEVVLRSVLLNPMAWIVVALGAFLATTRID